MVYHCGAGRAFEAGNGWSWPRDHGKIAMVSGFDFPRPASETVYECMFFQGTVALMRHEHGDGSVGIAAGHPEPEICHGWSPTFSFSRKTILWFPKIGVPP